MGVIRLHEIEQERGRKLMQCMTAAQTRMHDRTKNEGTNQLEVLRPAPAIL